MTRFAMLSLLAAACGDNRSSHDHRGPLQDAALDAIDARQYECASEADCDPGELCCVTISPGGAVQNPTCAATSGFCTLSLCDPSAPSCTKPDLSPGTCHTGVSPSPFDPRHWSSCEN